MQIPQRLQRLGEAARAKLLAISAYTRPDDEPGIGYSLESAMVERLRRSLGGQLSQPAITQTRWYMADLETAERMADTGDMSLAGRLMHAARKDGHLAGVLSTRTGGLVRLPKKFRGDYDVRKALEPGHESVRSVFDEMFPPSELALLAADGLLLGIGVAELLPVQGRDYPVLARLDPQYLQYVWTENRWYYRSAVGRLPITPGDGRWVLHVPGGRVAPWQSALWRAVGRAYVRKEHALLHKDNWEAKLAHPARVAVAPQGAAEEQKQSFFHQVMGWGINSVFGMTPGYDVKLVESNGRGWESFDRTVEQQNDEFVIAIAGQKVTTDGGAGFQNSDIHKSIRADLIKDTADGLAYTINTQGIPVFVAARWGEEAIDQRLCAVEWDVTPPKDRNSEAQSLVTVANAVQLLTAALAPSGMVLDTPQLAARFGVPVAGDTDGDGVAEEQPQGAPALALLPGGADGSTPAAAPAGAEAPAQDSALNGAQIASLLEVVTAVATGQIPRDAAVAIIKRAFLVDDATANALLGSVGNGFTSSAAPAPAQTEQEAA